MLILLFITVALWAVGCLLWAHLRPLSADGAFTPPHSVSVIIPARNEEHNLPTLLRSLGSQPIRVQEIVVVDDGSTDRTAELARALGAKVVLSSPLPEGWRGKSWACHQGASAATGDLLLFLDADTWFEPDGLAKILACYSGGAFSVAPYHAVRQLYEELSLFFNLNMVLGTISHRLLGQLLLVDGESYRRAGGHESVKGRVLENFHLSEQFHAHGIAVGSVTGAGAFSFRMYPNGLRELIAGWVKGFASGAEGTPGGRMLVIVAWMIGLVLAPIGALKSGDWLSWGAVYLLFALQVGGLGRQVGAFRWYTALLYPVPLAFFFVVFAWSKIRSGQEVHWKGRTIRAD